jgi:hypothetical protein
MRSGAAFMITGKDSKATWAPSVGAKCAMRLWTFYPSSLRASDEEQELNNFKNAAAWYEFSRRLDVEK